MMTIYFQRLLVITALFLVILQGRSQSPLRLYLGNDDHTDFMWTANEIDYDSAFVKMLDFYLAKIDSSLFEEDDFQVRFNCDGSRWLRAYEKYRSPEQIEKLLKYIRSGHISIPLNYLVSTYGGQPTEAIIRGMYHAGQEERNHQIRFRLAVAMENQTLPLGLSSLWCGSGARFSWRGICGCASKIPTSHRVQRVNQLYQYVGHDNRSIVMKWYDQIPENNRSLGGYAETRTDLDSLPQIQKLGTVIKGLERLCTQKSSASPYPFGVAAAFGFGWDDLSTFSADEFQKAAKKYSTPSRKVRVSNEIDFFQDVSRRFPNLPSETVTYGNEWDTYCASMNESTARVRRAIEKLRTGEALAVTAALTGRDFTDLLARKRKQAWEALGSYWEHDWTADGAVSRNARASWQIKIQRQISEYADTLFELAGNELARQLPSGADPRFFVFNSLSWVRTDIADFQYSHPPENALVIDLETEKEIPSQIVMKGKVKFIRILATNVPSLGFKTYEIREGNSGFTSPAAVAAKGYLKNRFLRISLLPSGAIDEWYDSLANARQLVNTSKLGLLNDLNPGMPAAGTLTMESCGPVSVTWKAKSVNPFPHSAEITLYHHTGRVDIEDSISSNFANLKTWTFSFNLTKPTTHFEELGDVITARTKKRGGAYADKNARYDWITFNHFASLSKLNYGVTVSNLDCSFFKLGDSSVDSLWEDSAELHALAGGQTDGPLLGIQNQNGDQDFAYHFSLRTYQSDFDPVSEMKFSLEHQNPLIGHEISGTSTLSKALSFSLFEVSDPSVLAWSVKPAEEGLKNGLILRLWNLGINATRAKVTTSFKLGDLWETSHLETNEQKKSFRTRYFSADFVGNQMNTYRLILKSK